MKIALAAGVATAAALGAVARRWWDRRTQFGPWGSVAIGLSRGVDSVDLALLQTTGTQMVAGNRLTPRDNAEVFDAIEEAIRAARHSVHVDVYIWKPGQPGERIAELICRRAREGVAVRILGLPRRGRQPVRGRVREALADRPAALAPEDRPPARGRGGAGTGAPARLASPGAGLAWTAMTVQGARASRVGRRAARGHCAFGDLAPPVQPHADSDEENAEQDRVRADEPRDGQRAGSRTRE